VYSTLDEFLANMGGGQTTERTAKHLSPENLHAKIKVNQELSTERKSNSLFYTNRKPHSDQRRYFKN
jgi:hypothetical protein